jgi:hypothetical protein
MTFKLILKNFEVQRMRVGRRVALKMKAVLAADRVWVDGGEERQNRLEHGKYQMQSCFPSVLAGIPLTY